MSAWKLPILLETCKKKQKKNSVRRLYVLAVLAYLQQANMVTPHHV